MANHLDPAKPVEQSLDKYYTQNPGTSVAAAPDKAVSTGYDASTASLDPTKSASGQMAEITAQDSPLMQRAKQEGVLGAARRGLQNSSIAVGAAQGAMADRATPLALKNSELYQNQQIENQRAGNRATEINTGRETQTEQFNVGNETDVNKFNVAESNQMASDVMKTNADINKQGLTGNQAIDLQKMDDSTKRAISESQTAASLYNSYISAVNSLFSNTSLTPDRLAALTTGLKNTLEGGANFINGMAGLNLSGGANPVTPSPAPTPPPPPATSVQNTGIYNPNNQYDPMNQ